MSVFQVLKIGRKLHPNTVLIIDDYDKYDVYDKDCYVIYQILNFDIKGKKNLFIWNRIEYLSYLVKKLKEQKIDYKVLCKRHGYEIVDEDYFSDNQYRRCLKSGKFCYQRKQKIDQIYHQFNYSLKRNPEKVMEWVKKIEGIIYV